MADGKRCGVHTELSTSPAAKITRCGCGTVHVHIVRSGVTVQLSAEQFAEVSATVAGAHDALKAFGAGGRLPSDDENPTIN
jgi:hypothetical protein